MKRAVVAVLAVLALAACGGEEPATEGATPEEVLAEAKTQLDEATSWRLSLSTTSVPESGNGVLSAEGVGTHAPAWEGEVKVLFNGLNASVPIVAVDGKVHAKLPLTPSWAEINPAEYGAQPLLGVNGYAYIGHGSSDARAVASAIRTAEGAVAAGALERTKEALAALAVRQPSE